MDDFPLDLNDGLTLEGEGDALSLGGDELALDTSEIAPDQADADAPFEPEEIEQEAAGELSELLAGFKSRSSRENERFVQATDSEYWFCVCFQTREQKEEFLQKLRLLELGDKYLDGLLVAKRLGVKIESPVPPLPTIRGDNSLVGLT